ncbi:PelD GGDEF domain-containing protein [Comamonas sp. NLF-1-9]|uniref:PelD GGDEF domain-containing protein n=1 Tax=Comamonas sp. NLF-1-9 TaxID=2853163 RepID=UPI001C46184A|nr:PelD GGDEF domain-containing protein [Comamonas sp. NLF-1-9]QXL83254.1 PelD GGDEF domain-containing protein [Comamonas sp. NLF-1-9]
MSDDLFAREQPAQGSGSPGDAGEARSFLPPNLLGNLVVTKARPAVVLGETLFLPLLAFVLGYLWSPDDPLQLHGNFPWPWFAPVIVALRHGFVAGLGGSSILLFGWLWSNFGRFDEFPQVHFFAGLALVMLVAEFSSLWRARTRRAETLERYLEQRLQQLVHEHYLLRLSHDRLEQELISRPMSMRDALAVLHDIGSVSADQPPPAARLLNLLVQYCQLEVASIHPVRGDVVDEAAWASTGGLASLAADDPLVRQALVMQRLCHVGQRSLDQQDTQYLVAAPLLDLARETYGLLLVRKMPFFALQPENLQTIQLLLGYYTDGLSVQGLARSIVEAVPDCPPAFAFELRRMMNVRQTTGVASAVVVLEFAERAVQRGLAAQIEHLKRELDEMWLLEREGRQALAVLMPLAGKAATQGYLARLETWAAQKGSHSLADLGVFPHILTVDGDETLVLIARIEAVLHA